MHLEESKILCDTVKKILYGIEFKDLPSASILRCIERNIGVNLVFKNHFRFLVPQVSGWEFMDRWVERRGWLRAKPDGVGDSWLHKVENTDMVPLIESPTYFEVNRSIQTYFENDRYDYLRSLEYAESVGLKLVALLVSVCAEIREEEAYLIFNEKRKAVIDEMYRQFNTHLENDKTVGDAITEFIDDLVENKLMKYESTLSGEDSGLETFWDEFCVQVQQEHSYFWNSYLDTLTAWIKEAFEKLPVWKRNAFWFYMMDENINEDVPCDEYFGQYNFENVIKDVDVENKCYYDFSDVNDYITAEIEEKAADYCNAAIEKYIEGGYEKD